MTPYLITAAAAFLAGGLTVFFVLRKNPRLYAQANRVVDEIQG